jgi:ABC-type iron transport system FetAB ATPase subunit
MKVYLLVNGEGKFKIGFTERTTEKRIKELQTGSHSEMHVLQEYESNNARQIETILHRFLRSKRISGEWFELTNEEVFDFKNRCKKIDENLTYLKENKI